MEGSEVGDGLGVDLPRVIDAKEVYAARLHSLVEGISVNGGNAEVFQFIRMIGERPDLGPEEVALAHGKLGEPLPVAFGGGSGFLNGEAIFGRDFLGVDASPEVEGALVAVLNEFAIELHDHGIEVDFLAADLKIAADDFGGGILPCSFDEADFLDEGIVLDASFDDLGVSDLGFQGQLGDGFLEYFVFLDEVLDGADALVGDERPDEGSGKADRSKAVKDDPVEPSGPWFEPWSIQHGVKLMICGNQGQDEFQRFGVVEARAF